MFHTFLDVFLPLFVAIDPIGMLPVFLGVTSGMTVQRRRFVTLQSVGTATLIAIGFVFAGNALFRFLGIGKADFMIAGGIVLLVLSVLDLLLSGKPAVSETDTVGIVPLAMPLIAGPATLTTALVLVRDYGHAWALLGLGVNFGLLLLAMLGASRVADLLGINTLRALSKLVMILLAAIAVNFIRRGIMLVIAEVLPVS